MQEKGKTLMLQPRNCRSGDTLSPIPCVECVLLCHLLCGVLHYRPRTKPLYPYCHSCSLVISLRSFSSYPHRFPALKSALSRRHFRSNEKVVRNFLLSLSTNF
ncbi:hypothetical protein AVEN_132027-1 [Araneus ventricosus]|uniref:Uncharacterized protein n=1 Tax=Araneus ventricosus TaxID=182803 RepID=A0A4Y2B2T5_ARAVE|nr:hypothetical protein AVEN_132027-1 [Araneus ventricosus]